MYTELVLNSRFIDNTPKDVIEALQWMLEANPEDEKPLIEHPLFELIRAKFMLRMGSFYFVPEHSSKMISGFDDGKFTHLSIRCDLKNYENEIETFLDWICPYLDDEFLGYMRYEEDDDPTLIYQVDGKPKYSTHKQT